MNGSLLGSETDRLRCYGRGSEVMIVPKFLGSETDPLLRISKISSRCHQGIWVPHANCIPESARLQSPIILFAIGFATTTHERSLYTATINGFQVLRCRQVDDLAIARTGAATAQWVTAQIGAKVEVTDGGIRTTFNGVDIDQTADYRKVSC
jgi:hypothetical protein